MLKPAFMYPGVAALLLCTSFPPALHAQRQGLVANWTFAQAQGASPVDTVHGIKATLDGYYKYVPGVSGDAVRFDGYTTSMGVSSQTAPALTPNGFTVEAWVALNTYPWNWVPVVDRQQQRQQGFAFGIDAFGHLGLQASIDGQWQTLLSTATLPLKKWVHIAAVCDTSRPAGRIIIYIDGTEAGQLPVHGEFTPSGVDILIGRVRQPVLPFPQGSVRPQYPIWYSLDGILDDVSIGNRALTSQEIAASYTAVKPPPGDVLPWPKMPSGPPGPGRFGAYYDTLRYQDTWDRLRRIGPDSDVVVRFDQSPIRLVFWQGTNYIPAWVTENDKWYTNEFLETWEYGCPLGGDCEPMSDKQSRYSRVSILESDKARVIIHWRYALSEVEKYLGAWPDPRTGWTDWADEYWTIYPDGVAIRKQVLHSTQAARLHEWQETIVLHQPGSRPIDDIDLNAITLENMEGQTKTYTWRPKPAGVFTTPNGPPAVTGPPDPNIQIVNMKSRWKPFQIVSPDGAHADIYNNEKTYFDFLCWNHWPVAQIASSDRPCVAADRASHSSLSHLYWKTYATGENTETKIMMNGLTAGSPAQLLPLARSWLSPPKLQAEGDSYRNDGYDPTQRAYVLARTSGGHPVALRLTFAASEASPVVNPAVVIKDWGEQGARLKVNGKPTPPGSGFRLGHIQRLEGASLVLWIRTSSTTPLHLDLTPLALKPATRPNRSEVERMASAVDHENLKTASGK